ncbi:MAG: septation protein IspZ [Polyangiaceae bacterium]|nr:septation protein IspZ [Polyangiaceae bacterium]
MSILVDTLPIVAFLVAYFARGIYVATAVLMAASVLQVAVQWFWKRRVEKLHLFSLGLALVLGGLTLGLNNDNFIKWKPSVFLWLFSAVILGRQWLTGALTIRTLLEKVMPQTGPIEPNVWQRINSVWGWAMALAGALNLVVAFYLPMNVWVIYKLVSLVVMNLALAVYTTVALGASTKGAS